MTDKTMQAINILSDGGDLREIIPYKQVDWSKFGFSSQAGNVVQQGMIPVPATSPNRSNLGKALAIAETHVLDKKVREDKHEYADMWSDSLASGFSVWTFQAGEAGEVKQFMNQLVPVWSPPTIFQPQRALLRIELGDGIDWELDIERQVLRWNNNVEAWHNMSPDDPAYEEWMPLTQYASKRETVHQYAIAPYFSMGLGVGVVFDPGRFSLAAVARAKTSIERSYRRMLWGLHGFPKEEYPQPQSEGEKEGDAAE